MKQDRRHLRVLIAIAVVSYLGVFLISHTDLVMMAFYPLYISIILGVAHLFKYRYTQLHFVNPNDLAKEVTWNGYGIIGLSLLTLVLTVFKVLAFGILLALYLFLAALIFNAVYLYRYLNKTQTTSESSKQKRT